MTDFSDSRRLGAASGRTSIDDIDLALRCADRLRASASMAELRTDPTDAGAQEMKRYHWISGNLDPAKLSFVTKLACWQSAK